MTLSATTVNALTAGGGIILAAGLIWVIKLLAKVVHVGNQLKDGLLGEPARPGFDARPGIMERTANLEHQVSGLDGKLEAGLEEAKSRIEKGLDETRRRVDSQFEEQKQLQHNLSEQVHEIKGVLSRINGGPAKPA